MVYYNFVIDITQSKYYVSMHLQLYLHVPTDLVLEFSNFYLISL